MKNYVQWCLITIIGISGVIACSETSDDSENWFGENDPQEIGTSIVEDLLSRADIMRYETDFLSTVHYAEAITGMGALHFSASIGDTATMRSLQERYETILENADQLPANHVDANVIGVLPLEMYIQTEKEQYLSSGLRMADSQWEDPMENGLTNQSRFWVDDLYMIGILQKKAFEATGDSVYLDRAALQFEAYLERLQQPNGLFHHGEEAPFFWGRGNGWVAVGMAELMTILPPDHPSYEAIENSFTKMMSALLKYQDESGMWRQLIDYDEAWEESSGTAMFGYAMKLGADAGVLTDPAYESAYKKSWNALAGRLNESGQLQDICVGTGKSAEPSYYLERPVVTGDLHGQAPLLWFATELVSTQ